MNWIIYLISFIWGILCWKLVFKATKFTAYASSVMDIKQLTLNKKNLNKISFLILLLTFLTGIYLAIYGLNLIFYILLMSLVFLFIIRINIFFMNEHGTSFFIIGFILIAFLGNFTGSIASDVQSPLLLEVLFLGIFLIPYYINYKLIFNKQNKLAVILCYLEFFKKMKIKNKAVKKVGESLSLLQKVDNINVLLEKGEQNIDFLIRKKSFEKINILISSKLLSSFVQGNFNELIVRRKRLESINKFSEFLSIISSGGIGGDDFESIIRACWDIKEYEIKKEDVYKKNYELEISKSQMDSLLILREELFLLFVYKYLEIGNKNESKKIYDEFLNSLKSLITILKWRNEISGGILRVSYYEKELDEAVKLRKELF